MGVWWVGISLVCVPSLPLRHMPAPQVSIFGHQALPWWHRIGHVHTSPSYNHLLIACCCTLFPLCSTALTLCCQGVCLGTVVIYSNSFACATLSIIPAFLILWPAVCCQEVLFGAASYSNLLARALSALNVFLILLCVRQVLFASTAISVASFVLPVRTMCPLCIAAAVVHFLCVLPLSRLLLTRLSLPAVQVLVMLQRLLIIVLIYF